MKKRHWQSSQQANRLLLPTAHGVFLIQISLFNFCSDYKITFAGHFSAHLPQFVHLL